MPILVVEDEKKLADFVAAGLRAAQFEGEVVGDGTAATSSAEQPHHEEGDARREPADEHRLHGAATGA